MGEIWATEVPRCSDPRNPDPDNDWTLDGKDPYQIYPFVGIVRRVTNPAPALDFMARKYRKVARLSEAQTRISFSIFAGWSSDSLNLTITGRETSEQIRVYIDFNNDGWHVGADTTICDSSRMTA